MRIDAMPSPGEHARRSRFEDLQDMLLNRLNLVQELPSASLAAIVVTIQSAENFPLYNFANF
jgi:hypothetical protein